MSRLVPQFRPYIDLSDYEALRPIFEGSRIAEGPFSDEFRKQLLKLTGAQYGCFASNGTVAIYLALKACGIGPGDEVLVPDITFIASANAVEMVGARPVFVDIVSFNDASIDPAKVRITEKTKAIILCHLFGTAASSTLAIKELCKDRGILLIEDAAQALGIDGAEGHCGTFGSAGTFSFYADKTITTAEGGFVITNDENVYDRMLYLRNQGRRHSGTFVHDRIGYNFRITEMQAAMGLSQLTKFERIKRAKSDIYTQYVHHLGDAVELLSLNNEFSHIPFRVVAFVPEAQPVMEHMQANGVEARSMFFPLHRQPCYQGLAQPEDRFPESDTCFARGLCLPTWVGLTEDDIAYVAGTVKDALVSSA